MVILLAVGGGGEELDNSGSTSSSRSLSSSSASSLSSSSSNHGLGRQPAVNQLIARHLARADSALITSLADDLYTEVNHPQRSYMTYNGPNQPVIPESNPHRTYARLFGGVTASPRDPPTPMEVNRGAAQARAFDIASAELAEIQRSLGAEEKINLANGLKAVPEGHKPLLLDNIITHWGCEMGIAPSHRRYDVAYTIIGGRNIDVGTGRYLQFDQSEPHPGVRTRIQHAFGMPAGVAGSQPNSGPLRGVLV